MTPIHPGLRPRTGAVLLALAFTAACASGDPELADVAPVSEPGPVASAAMEPTSEGVFTLSQAERGEEVYADVCLECHTRVEFQEDAFLFAWEGSSVATLLAYLRESMPDDAPGSLPERSYVDVTAYILQMNGWTPGARELQGDDAALADLTFEAR